MPAAYSQPNPKVFETGGFHAPAGVRLVAIGDIHGHLGALKSLLKQIEDTQKPEIKDHLIFLGDFIDRGPDSRGVLEHLMRLSDDKERSVTCLIGNHEELLLNFLQAPDTRSHMIWLQNGGLETLKSYGVEASVGTLDIHEISRLWARAQRKIPKRHIEFLECLPDLYQAGDFIFVHAGLRPGVPIANQIRAEKIWIRDVFLQSQYDFGGLVVHGHTSSLRPDLQKYRLGIDTGMGKGGYLTAATFCGSEGTFLCTSDWDE